MEMKQKALKGKKQDEISLEDIFKLVKQTWPQLKNNKIHKALKHILEFGLLRSASKEDLKGLNIIAKLLIKHETISEANELLELTIENGEMEAALIIVNHGGILMGSKLPKSHMTPIELSLTKGYLFETQYGAHYDIPTSNGLTLLQQAIMDKNIELIEILISHGASVHTKGNHESPLILALEYGLIDVAKLLIKSGAAIETKTIRGYTPLHACLGYGHLEMAYFLIAKGANLEALNHGNVTPLHIAAQNNHIEIVKLLLDKNVDPNPETENSETPLQAASKFGHTKIVKILLEAGAKTNIKDVYGMYPIHHAAYGKNLEVLELLLENGANVNEKVVPTINTSVFSYWSPSDFLHWTPLICAAYKGEIDIAKTLIKYGANIDAFAPGYSTPLRTAIDFKHTELCKFLISCGANINVMKDEDGSTPLHSAIEKNNEEICKLLILNGADVNARLTTNQISPLYVAIFCAKNLNICSMLISAGADVKEKDFNGETLLHILASFTGTDSFMRQQIIQLLIQSGACLNSRDVNGKTPEEKALAKKMIKIVKFINWCKCQM